MCICVLKCSWWTFFIRLLLLLIILFYLFLGVHAFMSCFSDIFEYRKKECYMQIKDLLRIDFFLYTWSTSACTFKEYFFKVSFMNNTICKILARWFMPHLIICIITHTLYSFWINQVHLLCSLGEDSTLASNSRKEWYRCQWNYEWYLGTGL